ncbi:ABC transporter substrate-binding protein [Nocardioides cavernae]|uniref:ABC transporter substrate-binding protein n=1 Tax=Nocardioides cavernae TaxID=1921566 RepID=A0ABR8N8N4_9ACTN|nr:ABC transporter substrate-binding protein [Nocardioides cavernae]MBD3924235.1 ABC transporter substrate-binding protein [Nocardioides cavernae]MBM7510826.1 4,5-dihydroxyphthalate decarboxylase [Nocardioides cavernae]
MTHDQQSPPAAENKPSKSSPADYQPATQADGSIRLSTAIGNRGVTQAILAGLPTPGWELEFHDVKPLPRAFRAMVNERSFHVSEMALTTLAMAIERGRPLIGIPAVLNRDFHYRSIVVRTGAGITSPADLVGRRVGVRAYSQTTGVWARGLLESEFGIDHREITWVTFEGAHVAEYDDPKHVERAPAGATILDMLAASSIDAAVIMDPQVDPAIATPLFPDANQRARSSHERDAIFPVNHVLAVDTATVEEIPDLPGQLYDLFLQSKQTYDARLAADGPVTPQDRHTLALGGIVSGDPNPFGVAANHSSCDQLLTYAHHQGLLARRMRVDELFHPSLF